MPTGHGRRRHAGREFARPTHSGYRGPIFGGVAKPGEASGAMAGISRDGIDFSLARDGEQAQMPDIGPEAVDTGNIRPGSLTRPLFAETIIPPEVVDALPALPDADYPQGVLVFLTTDMKLYRNTDGSTWSVEVDGADILANSITAGQIAAGAIGTTELAADAVIANVANVGGTVTIDDTGITIEDGALTFLDQFGATVLDGGGFGTTWLDFLDSGRVYNASFSAGTSTPITAATLFSGADSIADYEASLSDDIPYWVVSSESGAGTLTRAASTNAPSGFSLKWSGNETAGVFQDVPITPGQAYGISWLWKFSNSSSGFQYVSGYDFRTKTHALIGSLVEQSLPISTTQSNFEVWNQQVTTPAPQNARFIRVYVSMIWSSGSPTIEVAKVILNDIVHEGDMAMPSGRLLFGGTLGIGFSDDAVASITGGPDYELVWEDANSLALNAYNGSAGFRIRSANDITLSSTNHPLTIGFDSGLNLALDNNEIMARNNGATSTLNLNADGGDVASGGRIKTGFDVEFPEVGTAPGAPTNAVRIYADDSGGTTRLRAVGPGGVRVTLATF